MPTPRFQKLKFKKKNLFLESVKECLSKHDISELSVSDIAEEAEISRGTFYTYFSDIKDCIFTLIVYYLNQFFESLKVATNENNGDFIKTVKEQYKSIMDYISDEKSISIIKNIGATMNFSMAIEYYRNLSNYSIDFYKWFLNETDVGKKLNDTNKVIAFFTMFNNILLTAIVELSVGMDRKKIDAQTNYKFEWLSKAI